jgi:thymidine kinase
MNLRTDAPGHALREGAQVEIGGNERYVPMCRRHYKEALEGVRAPVLFLVLRTSL